MAQLITTIPDASLTRVINGICLALDYQAILPDGSANPLSKNQFARRALRDYVKGLLKIAEGTVAANAARRSVEIDVDTINITVV